MVSGIGVGTQHCKELTISTGTFSALGQHCRIGWPNSWLMLPERVGAHGKKVGPTKTFIIGQHFAYQRLSYWANIEK